jgi:hypothetical protein
MDDKPNSKAVRVEGEVIVLHCWACGTAHCVNIDLCAPAELTHMVCSNRKCRMSMFLVNELAVEDRVREMTKKEIDARSLYSRFWR